MIRIADDFLSNPQEVREQALHAEFIDWPGPDGETYKRICIAEIPVVREGIERMFGPVEMLGMAYRLNYGGEMPNAAIHSDMGWGTHAMVLYLCDGEGGTAFWQHKATGASRMEPGDFDLLAKVEGDWDDADEWDRLYTCPLKFNRAVFYDGSQFHSRYPFEAFGDCPENGRLIAVAFFTPEA